MSRTYKDKYLPIIALAIMILFATFMSVKFVYATGGSFNTKVDELWDNYSNSLEGSETETFPYDTDKVSITSVSLDVLYGTTRNLVFYHGEVPYDTTYDDEDEYLDGWEGYYAEDGTSASGSNPSYGASTTPSATDFWGSGISSDSFVNVPTAEQINGSSIVSLRLLAYANTKTGFSMWFGVVLYSVVKFFAWLAVLIIGLIVRAKNLNMDIIMEVLHLDKLSKMMTNNFIWDNSDPDKAHLSAFTLFCILALILSLVIFTYKWVKGADKTKGLWEILGTAGIGLLVIGMCLSGNFKNLGNTIGDLASAFMYTVSQSIDASGGSAFSNDLKDTTTDGTYKTEITQISEMSLVNKTFIDLQICSQFNVADIKELNFKEFGDSSGSTAKSYLSGVTYADMAKDFNNNLGYYYWFANSSAQQKTSLNKEFPKTDTLSVTNKLSSMITYLQVTYNATGKDNIVRIVRSLANPNGYGKFLAMLVFAVALVLMALVLLKYALAVVIAKLELFVSLLGMTIAGPLMLTSNKKLVDLGKSILGMMAIAVLEMTVYSVIFDIIIYAVSTMFSPKIPALLATVAMLILLWKLNPIIASNIKRILERTESRISPTLVNNRRALKNYMKAKANEGINRYDNSDHIVGYDATGNAIVEKRKGDALSHLMHHGANALLTEGNDHQGTRKINEDLSKATARTHSNSLRQRRMAAQQAVEDTFGAIDLSASETANKIRAGYNQSLDEAGEWDSRHEHMIGGINEAALNEDEKIMKHNMDTLDQEMTDIQNSERYRKLTAEKQHIEARNAERLANGEAALEMDEKHKAALDDMTSKIQAKKKELEDTQHQLEDSIKTRTAETSFKRNGLDYRDAEGANFDEKVNSAAHRQSLEEHKDELEHVLKTSIDTMTEEVNKNNERIQKKIGESKDRSKVNTEAATAQAAAMLQLKQLQSGEDVSRTSDAKQEVKEIVDQLSKYRDQASDTVNDVKAKRDQVANTRIFSSEHREAKAEYKDALRHFDENYDTEMAATNEMYTTARKEMGGGLVIDKVTNSEILQSAINNRVSSTSKAGTTMPRPTVQSGTDPMTETINNRSESQGNVVDSLVTPPVESSGPKQTTNRQSQPRKAGQSNQSRPQPQTQQQQTAGPTPVAPVPVPMPNNGNNRPTRPTQPQPQQNMQAQVNNGGYQQQPMQQAPQTTPIRLTRPQPQTQQQQQFAPARPTPQSSYQPEPTTPVQPREVVSNVEARQAQMRQAPPDMSSVINNRQSQQVPPARPTPVVRPAETPAPIHAGTDARNTYMQDEARRLQQQAENDFWSNKKVDKPGSRR